MTPTTRSTIMDTNSFQAEDEERLPETTRRLTRRRQELLGSAYRLFYREPVHLVRGEGQYLWDADGEKYLDLYNNVASIGHAHPRVVAAVTAQMSQLNTHTRYLHEGILDYTADLLGTMPDEIDRAMYMCTGSEANDLAIRVAREYTGGTGIVVTKESYHGTSALTSGFSPALGSNQPVDATARLIGAPDSYRVRTDDIGSWFAGQVQVAVDAMRADGIEFAGLLADSIFSSDGIYPGEPGMLKAAIDTVHRNGGVWIADEVQPGFARCGDAFWGFARHGITPDIVTTGKPMGNGMPVSALLAKHDVLAAFGDNLPYFNTFGGNPVSMAAAQAVLDVIREERLQEHAAAVGGQLARGLRGLAADHECVGDVRGAGLFLGLELVTGGGDRTPARTLALDLLEELRSRRVLTSVAGPHGNILKIRPPMAFQAADVDWAVGALDDGLRALGA